MPSYYDDNFGFYEGTDDEDVREFYHYVQEKSVRKKCKGCGRWVNILPKYAYCDSCANKIERGMELDY